MAVDRPISNKFISVTNDEVRGTIPRDYETRPHVQVSYDDTALRGQGQNDTKTLGLIGRALNGVPNHVYKINSINEAKSIFGGGDLLDAVELAWQPNMPAYGENGTIYAERVEDARRASLNAGALHFLSRIYGDKANNVQVRLVQSDLNNTWTIQITNRADGYRHTYNNLGLLANISYTPNAWSKYNMPAGAKDYSRASYEVKPRKIVRTINGKQVTRLTGQAGELVLRFHDTKQPAILHNNATNNITGGSTVYEDNGSEYESNRPANQGDPNPKAGPFVDWIKTFDLTATRYQNIWQLFKDMQELQGLNVEAVDDHDISHIPANLLDLTYGTVDIMPNLDDTTTDSQGDIVEPAGIWSTLGDIVDKLRNDDEVQVSADLSAQLNFVPATRNTSEVSLDRKSAASLASEASSANSSYLLNTSEASSAYSEGNPDTQSEFLSAAQSDKAEARNYSNEAAKLNSYADSVVDSEAANLQSADSGAASTVSSATKQLNSVQADLKADKRAAEYAGSQEVSYASMARSEMDVTKKSNASLAKSYATMAQSATGSSKAADLRLSSSYAHNTSNASASNNSSLAGSCRGKKNSALANQKASHKAAVHYRQIINSTLADVDAARSHADTHTKDNMQRVKNYVSWLIRQINKELRKGDTNIVDSDLNELSRVALHLSTPNDSYSNKMFRAGKAMSKHLQPALQARHNLLESPKAAKVLSNSLPQLKIDLSQVPSSEPAPKGLLVHDYGDGEINVLGEPIHAFTYTNLSGGYTKPTPLSWASKLRQFNQTPVYDMVALTDSPAIHQELAAYINDRYFADHNMQGFVGSGFKEPTQQLISRANDLDDPRMHLYGRSLYFPMQDGRKLHIPGYMTAAIAAGIDASIPVAASTMNKQVGAISLDVDFTSSDLDALDQNGVNMVVPIINHGVASKFVLSDDVSTANDGSDPIKSELQLSEDNDFLCDDLRVRLDKSLGEEINQSTASTLKNEVRDFLIDNKASAAAGNGGLITSFNEDDIDCEIHNETAYIVFSCVPVRTLKRIYARVSYNGYDEQVGTGTANANYFIGADNHMVADQGAETAENANTGNGISNGDQANFAPNED